jgi:hypothetical protein
MMILSIKDIPATTHMKPRQKNYEVEFTEDLKTRGMVRPARTT